MGAELVMAAGSALGGLAGKAIMGEPAVTGPDTSIPGISKATLQKKTKANDELSAAQVDPSGAINYFKQAAESNKSYVTTGLGMYQASIQQAVKSINNSYRQANTTLRPLANTGMNALNEYLKMVGVDPVDTTAGMGNTLLQLDPKLTGTSDLLNQLNQTTDPNTRAQLQKQINSQLSSAGSSYDNAIIKAQQSLSTLGPRPSGPSTNDLVNLVNNNKGDLALFSNSDWTRAKQLPQQQADYDRKRKELQTALDTAIAAKDQYRQRISNFQNEFNQNYSPTLDRAYTGEEIQDKITKTPGYQFQLNQGNQAVARTGLAAGMLGSGNTAAAAQEYGQGLASNYYQQYLQNLNTAVNQGLPALGQISNNQLGQGANLANLYTLAGQGAMNAYSNIGQGFQDAYTNAGTGYLQAALANMQAQNQVLSEKRQQEYQQQQQAIASAPGFLNAATSRAAFNYGVFQNQQGGQAFYGNTNQKRYY